LVTSVTGAVSLTLNVVLLNVIILSVVMLSVVMLCVVAPGFYLCALYIGTIHIVVMKYLGPVLWNFLRP
jgi:hypothetical protein